MIIPSYTQLVSKGWTTDSNTPICRITITNNTTGGAIDYMLESIGLKFAKGNAPNGIYENGTLVNSTSNVYAVIIDDDYPEYVLDSVNITKSVDVANKGTASSKGTFSTPRSDYMVNMNVRTVIYSGKAKSFTVYKGYPSLYNYYDNSILVNAPGFDINSSDNHYYAIDNNQDRYAVIRGYTWRSVNNIDYIVFEARPFFDSIQVSNNSSFSNSGSGVTITRNEYFFAIDITTGTLLDGPEGNVIGRVPQFANTYNLYARVIKNGTESSPVVLSGAVGPFGTINVTSNKSVISPSDDFIITYNSTNSITSTNENYVAFKINEYNHNYINYRSRRGYNQTITINTNPNNSSTANNTLIPLAREKNGIYASACNPIYINTRRIGVSYVTDPNTGYKYYSRWHGFTPDSETLVVNVKYPNPSISLNYPTISIGETITATAGNVYNKDTHNTVVPKYQYTVDNGSTWSNTTDGKHQFNSLSLVGSNCKFRTKVTNNNSANYPVLDSDWVVSNSIVINTYPRNMVANGFTYNFNTASSYSTMTNLSAVVNWSSFALNKHLGRFDQYKIILVNNNTDQEVLLLSGDNNYSSSSSKTVQFSINDHDEYVLKLLCKCKNVDTVDSTAEFTSNTFRYVAPVPDPAPELVYPRFNMEINLKDVNESPSLQMVYKSVTNINYNMSDVIKVIVVNAINSSIAALPTICQRLYDDVMDSLSNNAILGSAYINTNSGNLGYSSNKVHKKIKEIMSGYILPADGYLTTNNSFYKQSWYRYLSAYEIAMYSSADDRYHSSIRNWNSLNNVRNYLTQTIINNFFNNSSIVVEGQTVVNYFKTNRVYGDGTDPIYLTTYQQKPSYIFRVPLNRSYKQLKVYVDWSGGGHNSFTYDYNPAISDDVNSDELSFSKHVEGSQGYVYYSFRLSSTSTTGDWRTVRAVVVNNNDQESEMSREVRLTKDVSESYASRDSIVNCTKYNNLVKNACYMSYMSEFLISQIIPSSSYTYLLESEYRVNVGDVIKGDLGEFSAVDILEYFKYVVTCLSTCNTISENNKRLTWGRDFAPNTSHNNFITARGTQSNRSLIYSTKGNYFNQIIYLIKYIL